MSSSDGACGIDYRTLVAPFNCATMPVPPAIEFVLYCFRTGGFTTSWDALPAEYREYWRSEVEVLRRGCVGHADSWLGQESTDSESPLSDVTRLCYPCGQIDFKEEAVESSELFDGRWTPVLASLALDLSLECTSPAESVASGSSCTINSTSAAPLSYGTFHLSPDAFDCALDTHRFHENEISPALAESDPPSMHPWSPPATTPSPLPYDTLLGPEIAPTETHACRPPYKSMQLCVPSSLRLHALWNPVLSPSASSPPLAPTDLLMEQYNLSEDDYAVMAALCGPGDNDLTAKLCGPPDGE